MCNEKKSSLVKEMEMQGVTTTKEHSDNSLQGLTHSSHTTHQSSVKALSQIN